MAEENKLNQTPEITPAPSAEAPELSLIHI